MVGNPYEAPKSELEHATGEAAPPLWNPNAAASWCLIFSVAFGAYLHMKNWEALGEREKAAASKNWFIGSIVLLVLSLLSALFAAENKSIDGLVRLAFFVLLLSWYFASAKPQVKFIESRYGNAYPRKGWGMPLLFGVLAVVGLILFGAMAALIAGSIADKG